MLPIDNTRLAEELKQLFSPDGGAEREHNAPSGGLGFGSIHYSLVTNLRPERVLVIGSRYGFIPAVIALALRQNETGVLDFVDANYMDDTDGFSVAYGGVGHWAEDPLASFAILGLDELIRIHIMRSDEFFNTCESRYGYVYIDGDHSYEGARYDLEKTLARLAPGGMVAMHDVMVQDENFGIARLYDELDPRRFEKLTLEPWPGLGLIRPRREETE